jgi:hypothetical protein
MQQLDSNFFVFALADFSLSLDCFEQAHLHSTVDIEPEKYQLSSTDSFSQDDYDFLSYFLSEENEEDPERGSISISMEAPVSRTPLSLATNKKPSSIPTKKKRLYKSRHLIPDPKKYVDGCGDKDILCGRGELSNTFRGNGWYRDLAKVHKKSYRAATKKDKSTTINDILKTIRKQGGRFLEQESPKKWYVAHPKTAYTKVQTFLNGKASRAAKRAKYGAFHESRGP